MASVLRGVLARGITRNFCSGPVVDPSLLRGIRGRAAAHYHQFLDARIFSSSSVPNNQLLTGISLATSHHHQFLDARKFSSAAVTNNVNSESDFFSQLEKDRKVSILGIEWKLSFNQVMKSKFKGSNLPPLKPPGCQSNPTEHQINFSASSLIESVDRLLEDDPGCDILYGAMYMVYTDPRFQTYDEFAKMKVLSKVLEVIEKYPQIRWHEGQGVSFSHSEEVFHIRRRIKSYAVDDSKDILREEQVVSRVVEVVKSYLGVSGFYKVTRRTHFKKHLRLNYIDRRHINAALRTEFKMYVPLNVDSCERAIDYIYHNQKQRMSLQRFREQFCYANRLKERFRILCLNLAPEVASYIVAGGGAYMILNK